MGKIIDIVAQILTQLGANYTVYIQLSVFIIGIGFLTVFVYGPYFKAADERNKRTKGADTVVKETIHEAKNLQTIYQTKAREINEKIKTVFENKKNQASKKSSEILSQAKKDADQTASKARSEIETQLKLAEAQVAQISKEIAGTLNEKFEKGL